VTVLAAAGLVVAGACGKQLDVSKPERAIAAAIEQRYSIEVQGVSCPANLEAKKGSQFQCVVTLEDDRLTADVTQTDSSGGLRYQLAEQILTERSVAKAIRAQYNATSVDCGERTYWVAHPNRVFTCRARDDAGGSARITVTVRDERGNIDLDIAS
jgi:hypothetical protein